MKKSACCFVLFCILLFTSCSRETGTKAGGDGGSASAPDGNAPPQVHSCSLAPGEPTADQMLTVHYVCTDPDNDHIRYTFLWYVDGGIVQEGTLNTLEPGTFQKGAKVFAEIIPSDPYAAGVAARTETVTIGNLPPVIETIALKPADPPAGAMITAEPKGTDPDGDEVRYSYQWHVNDQPVTELQDSNVFNTKGLKKKDLIHVLAIPSDFDIAGKARASNVVVLYNRPPTITSSPQYGLTNGVYEYRVAAKDPDGDKLTYSLISSPPGMTINASTGLIRWETPKDVNEKQNIPVKISVEDGDGGSVTQEFSLTLEMK